MTTPFSGPMGLDRICRLAAASLLLCLAAGCGGGVYVDASNTDGPPPDIALSASVGAAVPGEPIELAAAVDAPNGLDYVSFYRVDPGADTLLGSVGSAPLVWDTHIPYRAAGSVTYYAVVCDSLGYCTDSADVTIDVLR